MVIDDEKDVLEKIKSSLNSDDFEVITASDSRQALELMSDAEEEKYGLILIDTQLPGTKESALFSMKPKSKIHTDISKSGDFLLKPFTDEQLRNFIKTKLK